MAILDRLTEFADNVAVAGSAATRNVGDVIDLQVVRDLGNGQPVYLYVLVNDAPTGATTVEFRLVSDSSDTIATDGSASLHWSSGAIAIANLPDGERFVVALPLEGVEYERYLGFQVVNVGATDLADLDVSAGLTLDPMGWKAYPEGNN